jgi:hypothetical protein
LAQTIVLLHRSRHGILIAIGALTILLAGCTTNRGAPPDDDGDGKWVRHPGPVTTRAVFIPSDVAGGLTPGLAAVIAFPDSSASARSAAGAAVCVVVQDGGGAGSISTDYEGFAPDGIVTIAFLLPGGGTGSLRSGGQFDYRGENCARAVADVIRFAQGDFEGRVQGETETKSLSEIVSYPVLSDEIIVLGEGNGGNLATISIGRFGSALGGLAGYVAWEPPAGDQFVAKELGLGAGQDSINIHYEPGSCAAVSCAVDYSTLSIDLSTPDVVDDPKPGGIERFLPGTVFFDDDGDGGMDPGEYVVHPLWGPLIQPGGNQAYFSLDLSRALQRRELRVTPLADTSAAATYWSERDPSAGSPNYYANALLNVDSLSVIVIGSKKDHLQSAPDHPHIVLEITGWRDAGCSWIRLNPDAAYVSEAGGVAGAENPANTMVTFGDVVGRLHDEGQPESATAKRAAVMEIADRIHSGVWEPDLDQPLITTGDALP